MFQILFFVTNGDQICQCGFDEMVEGAFFDFAPGFGFATGWESDAVVVKVDGDLRDIAADRCV